MIHHESCFLKDYRTQIVRYLVVSDSNSLSDRLLAFWRLLSIIIRGTSFIKKALQKIRPLDVTCTCKSVTTLTHLHHVRFTWYILGWEPTNYEPHPSRPHKRNGKLMTIIFQMKIHKEKSIKKKTSMNTHTNSICK